MNNGRIVWIVRAVCLFLALLIILGFVITLLPPAAASSVEAWSAQLIAAMFR